MPGKEATEKDVAKWINGLSGAYQDCKIKHKNLAELIDKAAEEAKKLNKQPR